MKQKLGNFWFYHKLHCIIAVWVILILADFAWQKTHAPAPDYSAALVAADQTAGDLCGRMEEALGLLWGGEDGSAEVEVLLYPYNGVPDGAADPSAFMAGAVQLAADLKNGISSCYFTDTPELLQAEAGLVLQGTIGPSSPLWQLEELRGMAVFTTLQDAAFAQKVL